ncbi:hypothetical protein SDC9_110246 [bioreactor metagenome]|uniref:Uncharacterized protein n=1 Tax=bioreactor metagenome TaxID=1076179 RepID=A0A645BE25_9ZZZZ
MEKSMMDFDAELKQAVKKGNIPKAKEVAVAYFVTHPSLEVVSFSQGGVCYEIKRHEGNIIFFQEV